MAEVVALCYPDSGEVHGMSQPVKLSDALVLDARLAGEAQERSIAGQVEFWARLGRSVESLLTGRQVLALRRSAEAQPLSEALASVDTPAGRKRVQEVLAGRPYPHFKQFPGRPGLLVRIDEDGTETAGRFVNRTFVPMEAEKTMAGKAPADETITAAKRLSGRPRANARQARDTAKPAKEPQEREAWV